MCYIFLFYNVGGVDVAVQVNIDDNKIDNFSDGAQTTLKKQMEKYADDIIKEANLIEEAIREDGANTEITSNIVLQAVRKNKSNPSKKPNRFLLITKIISSFSLLITGFLFDSSGYQNSFALQTLNIGTPRHKVQTEDSSQILEYEVVTKWRELEGIVNDISINSQVKTPRSIIQFLTENQFIDNRESNILKEFLKIRNNIVHSANNSYTTTELKAMLDEIDKIINKIKKIV